MKVVICEDDPKQLAFIHSKLKNYALMEHPSIEFILATQTPDDVLHFIKNDRADCYFLDIELEHEMNGLELATKIREDDPQASIIFVTTHAELLQLTFTYKLAALDFVLKQQPEQLIQPLIDALDAAFYKYTKIGSTDSTQFYQIKVGELIKNIPLDEIYCFSTAEQIHKVQVQTVNGIFEFYGSLKDVDVSSDAFFRCHNSFIVNLKQVQEYNVAERTVLLNNDMVCSVSFRKIRELKTKLAQHLTGS